jgi:hypothetical protein
MCCDGTWSTPACACVHVPACIAVCCSNHHSWWCGGCSTDFGTDTGPVECRRHVGADIRADVHAGAVTAVHDGLIAWLNRALKGLCQRTLHVSLPSGPVPLGDARLDPLLPGLRLVLRGSGQPAAGATVLNFGMADPLMVSGNDVRIEFSNMSLVGVRCAAHLPAARLSSARRAASRLLVAAIVGLASRPFGRTQGSGVVSIAGGNVSVAFVACAVADTTVRSSRPR